jgi:hypothetical protein
MALPPTPEGRTVPGNGAWLQQAAIRCKQLDYTAWRDIQDQPERMFKDQAVLSGNEAGRADLRQVPPSQRETWHNWDKRETAAVWAA